MMDAIVQVAAGPFEVVVGELKIDLLRQRASFKGCLLRLRPIEYRILEYLALRNGNPISGALLKEHLLGPGEHTCSNSIAVETCRLRTKLGREGCHYLPAVPGRSGKAYSLRDPKTAPSA